MLSMEELLGVLVQVYHSRARSGYSRFDASQFGSCEDIHRNYFASYPPEEVNAACRELDRRRLADVLYLDGHAYRVELRQYAAKPPRGRQDGDAGAARDDERDGDLKDDQMTERLEPPYFWCSSPAVRTRRRSSARGCHPRFSAMHARDIPRQ